MIFYNGETMRQATAAEVAAAVKEKKHHKVEQRDGWGTLRTTYIVELENGVFLEEKAYQAMGFDVRYTHRGYFDTATLEDEKPTQWAQILKDDVSEIVVEGMFRKLTFPEEKMGECKRTVTVTHDNHYGLIGYVPRESK